MTMLNPPSTTSLDLPPALASILNVGSTTPTPSMPTAPQATGLSSGMTNMGTFAPSYQQGGMIGMGGMPEPMSGMSQPANVGVNPNGAQGSMPPQMLEMQINQFATQRPQEMAQIRQAIMQELQSGALTQQELNTIVQLATVAAQNPEMYPYVRNFAIQQGIATEQDLPPQYDQGLVFVLLLAARAVQADLGGQNMMQGGSPAMAGSAIPSMARGGMTPDSKKADGSVLINAHEGEYVIPKRVVEMKGKEFFDTLVEKYKET
jgi:hypothetical protein